MEKRLKICGFAVKMVCKNLWIFCEKAVDLRWRTVAGWMTVFWI